MKRFYFIAYDRDTRDGPRPISVASDVHPFVFLGRYQSEMRRSRTDGAGIVLAEITLRWWTEITEEEYRLAREAGL